MNSQEKIQVLNKAAEKIREAIKEIDAVYADNKDVSYYIWKINKMVSLMHQAICKVLEKEITDEQFNDIIKTLREEN